MKPLILILPVIFKAIADGLYLHGNKVLSKQFGVLGETGGWLMVILVFGWNVYTVYPQLRLYGWKGYVKLFLGYVLVYFLLRAIFFNYAHNLAAGLPLNYIGQVSIVDRLLALACGEQKWMIYIGQLICLIAVIGIIWPNMFRRFWYKITHLRNG